MINFKEELEKQNIILTSQMEQQFEKYYSLILKYNSIMDLTSVNPDEIYERHFFNSLTIAFNKDFNNYYLCDVGSGAGFPAIPLKIVFPNMHLTIVDSLGKRMDFLKIVIKELDLKDVTIINDRVENIASQYREKFDIVTARAVAKLNILVELVSQLIKVNGTFIAMKGEKGNEELLEAKNALKTMHLSLKETISFDKSINFFFTKEKSIDKKYPRNYSQIKKMPL